MYSSPTRRSPPSVRGRKGHWTLPQNLRVSILFFLRDFAHMKFHSFRREEAAREYARISAEDNGPYAIIFLPGFSQHGRSGHNPDPPQERGHRGGVFSPPQRSLVPSGLRQASGSEPSTPKPSRAGFRRSHSSFHFRQAGGRSFPNGGR